MVISTILLVIVTAANVWIFYKQDKRNIKPRLVRRTYYFIRGGIKPKSVNGDNDPLFNQFFIIIPIHNIGRGTAQLISVKIKDTYGIIKDYEKWLLPNDFTFIFYCIPASIPHEDLNLTITYSDDDNRQKKDYLFPISSTELNNERDKYVLQYNDEASFYRIAYGGAYLELKDTFSDMFANKTILCIKSLH